MLPGKVVLSLKYRRKLLRSEYPSTGITQHLLLDSLLSLPFSRKGTLSGKEVCYISLCNSGSKTGSSTQMASHVSWLMPDSARKAQGHVYVVFFHIHMWTFPGSKLKVGEKSPRSPNTTDKADNDQLALFFIKPSNTVWSWKQI